MRPATAEAGGRRKNLLSVIYLIGYTLPVDAFEAIAEPNRRRILDLLQGGERPAGDVVEALAISQPGVSKHLRLLREAGLVRVRADGQRRLYSVEPRRLAAIEAWLRPHLEFWRGRLGALETHLDKEQ